MLLATMSLAAGHIGDWYPGATRPRYPGATPPDVSPSCHGSTMTNDRRLLRGTELRYALTMYLFQHGPTTVADLIDALDFQGFAIAGRPSKAVSDALRWEIVHGRVRRLKRGRYGPVVMPRSTEYRIHRRVLALREEAAQLRSKDADAFWDAIAAYG